MPLVVDQLQLWTIGFKWAGLDPHGPWLRIPAPVRDNFSTLLEAVLNQHLDCIGLNPEKYEGNSPEDAKFHVRYWLDDVYAAVHGKRFNRKLLRWAVIERSAFRDWCERCSIPLPEFWFPPGWTDYRWPEDDPLARGLEPSDSTEAVLTPDGKPMDVQVSGKGLRDVARFRIASQVIAESIWREAPATTIAAMVQHDLIQNYGGAKHYGDEAVRRWVKEVAPPEVSAKKGRPKKKNPTENE